MTGMSSQILLHSHAQICPTLPLDFHCVSPLDFHCAGPLDFRCVIHIDARF